MKTNYINQLQRDMFLMGNDNDTPLVEDVSMEERAEKYAYDTYGCSNETQNEWEDCQRHFIAGQQQLLPIIKELGEALIKANLYVPPKFYGQGESYENEDYTKIQTTLNKYKNYL